MADAEHVVASMFSVPNEIQSHLASAFILNMKTSAACKIKFFGARHSLKAIALHSVESCRTRYCQISIQHISLILYKLY